MSNRIRGIKKEKYLNVLGIYYGKREKNKHNY